MTKIRFQADADLKQAIVTGTIRRETNIDFQSAYVAGLEGKTDLKISLFGIRIAPESNLEYHRLKPSLEHLFNVLRTMPLFG